MDRYVGIPICLFLKFLDLIFGIRKTAGKSQRKKILVIKLTMMGDTILLYPAVKTLRKKYKDSHIALICSKVNKPITEDWDFIDECIVFDFKEYFLHPWRFFNFLTKVKKEKYDLVLDFEQWFRITPIIAFFSFALETVGYKTACQHRHYLYSNPVLHDRKKHEVECFLDIVKAVGVEGGGRSLELKVDKRSSAEIDAMLHKSDIKKNERFVIVHPGCGVNGYMRQWDEERYSSVVEYIQEKYGLKVILTGDSDEKKIVEKVIGYMKSDRKPVDFSGKTTLKQLIALVDKAFFVVCGNTGILHIASALDKPVVAIHGPTDPIKWGPRSSKYVLIKPDLACAPCAYLGFEYGCREKKCLKGIAENEVKEAVDKIVREIS